ncbi:hypothetical protein O181_048666 [Austropuccinia psidii MF-1]|uniref:PNPLA domain-containing protein n=1 Tax=Austropuccinia psidii MF-1 TaxID=1389203 RepID=A0A9Q3DR39_9BASI|nr:hypothetical protein [Austropuccinia psidii MF-1]
MSNASSSDSSLPQQLQSVLALRPPVATSTRTDLAPSFKLLQSIANAIYGSNNLRPLEDGLWKAQLIRITLRSSQIVQYIWSDLSNPANNSINQDQSQIKNGFMKLQGVLSDIQIFVGSLSSTQDPLTTLLIDPIAFARTQNTVNSLTKKVSGLVNYYKLNVTLSTSIDQWPQEDSLDKDQDLAALPILIAKSRPNKQTLQLFEADCNRRQLNQNRNENHSQSDNSNLNDQTSSNQNPPIQKLDQAFSTANSGLNTANRADFLRFIYTQNTNLIPNHLTLETAVSNGVASIASMSSLPSRTHNFSSSSKPSNSNPNLPKSIVQQRISSFAHATHPPPPLSSSNLTSTPSNRRVVSDSNSNNNRTTWTVNLSGLDAIQRKTSGTGPHKLSQSTRPPQPSVAAPPVNWKISPSRPSSIRTRSSTNDSSTDSDKKSLKSSIGPSNVNLCSSSLESKPELKGSIATFAEQAAIAVAKRNNRLASQSPKFSDSKSLTKVDLKTSLSPSTSNPSEHSSPSLSSQIDSTKQNQVIATSAITTSQSVSPSSSVIIQPKTSILDQQDNHSSSPLSLQSQDLLPPPAEEEISPSSLPTTQQLLPPISSSETSSPSQQVLPSISSSETSSHSQQVLPPTSSSETLSPSQQVSSPIPSSDTSPPSQHVLPPISSAETSSPSQQKVLSPLASRASSSNSLRVSSPSSSQSGKLKQTQLCTLAEYTTFPHLTSSTPPSTRQEASNLNKNPLNSLSSSLNSISSPSKESSLSAHKSSSFIEPDLELDLVPDLVEHSFIVEAFLDPNQPLSTTSSNKVEGPSTDLSHNQDQNIKPLSPQSIKTNQISESGDHSSNQNSELVDESSLEDLLERASMYQSWEPDHTEAESDTKRNVRYSASSTIHPNLNEQVQPSMPVIKSFTPLGSPNSFSSSFSPLASIPLSPPLTGKTEEQKSNNPWNGTHCLKANHSLLERPCLPEAFHSTLTIPEPSSPTFSITSNTWSTSLISLPLSQSDLDFTLVNGHPNQTRLTQSKASLPVPKNPLQAGWRILSLDGGGIRGLSMLCIVHELMSTIQARLGLKQPPLPCEIFEMITGTGTGGIIALLLGRLRLETSVAIEAYLRIVSIVFSQSKRSMGAMRGKSRFSGSKLENVVKQVVEQVMNTTESSLADPQSETGCKTFLIALMVSGTKGKVQGLKTLRTYSTHQAMADQCSIHQAARATSAAPLFFKPVQIEASQNLLLSELMSKGTIFSNPCSEALVEARGLLPQREIDCLISLGAGSGSGQGSGSVARACAKMRQSAEEVAERVEKMAKQEGWDAVYSRISVGNLLNEDNRGEWERPELVEMRTIDYLSTSGREVFEKVSDKLIESVKRAYKGEETLQNLMKQNKMTQSVSSDSRLPSARVSSLLAEDDRSIRRSVSADRVERKSILSSESIKSSKKLDRFLPKSLGSSSFLRGSSIGRSLSDVSSRLKSIEDKDESIPSRDSLVLPELKFD